MWSSQSGGDDQDREGRRSHGRRSSKQVSIVEAVVYLSEPSMCEYKTHFFEYFSGMFSSNETFFDMILVQIGTP